MRKALSLILAVMCMVTSMSVIVGGVSAAVTEQCVCSNCLGTGVIETKSTCSNCSGSGTVTAYNYVTCHACNGKPTTTITYPTVCSWCKGFGGTVQCKCSCGNTWFANSTGSRVCSKCGKTVSGTRLGTCSTCGGTGTRTTTTVSSCSTCRGTGKVATTSYQQTCSSCSGFGFEAKSSTCSQCNGVGKKHLHISTINVKDATIGETGYTGDTYCTDCKTILEYGESIPKLERKIIDSGICGRYLTWEYDNANMLSVFGTGAMDNYSYSTVPWHKYCENIKTVVIDKNVTTISGDAFNSCKNLTSITIPNSVTTIGEGAFSGCASLKSVTIPTSVTTISGDAFNSCKNLTSITIPNSVTTIGEGAFSFCTSLKSVAIPTSVTTISEGAFFDCTSLKSVTIPTGVTTISSSAFSYCSSLKSVTIPTSVTTISNNAFYNCTGLTAINWNAKEIVNFGADVFYNAGIYGNGVKVTFGNNVKKIPDWAFFDCKGLTSVTIGNSVTTIGNDAFFGCTGLTSIAIPNSVSTIGSDAFWGCKGLKSIAIPKNVTIVGSYAFANCTGLKSVYLPKGIKYIENKAFYQTYFDDVYYCGNSTDRKSIKIRANNGTLTQAKWHYNAHHYNNTITKATLSKNGKVVKKCSGCGASTTSTIYYPKTFTLSTTAYTYNSSAKTPTVTVKDANGKVIASKYYTLTYSSGRKAIGTYSVKITFKGNYSGTKTLSFKILPAKPTVTATAGKGSATLSWKKAAGAAGYQVYYSTAKSSGYKKVTTTTALKVTKKSLKKGKTYYFRVRSYKKVGSTYYYSGWVTKSVKVK